MISKSTLRTLLTVCISLEIGIAIGFIFHDDGAPLAIQVSLVVVSSVLSVKVFF